ncbi:hypothetical protein MMC25_007455 [Agyrium rufum]|nr:hypothetical protein [Agyrium rufum]
MSIPDHAGFNFCRTIHADTYPFVSPRKLNLTGKSVFITGASKGIGRATALSYAQAGASPIGLSARSSLSTLEDELASAAQAAGHEPPLVKSYAMDVTDAAAVERVAKQVERDFSSSSSSSSASSSAAGGGRLDILINNAGYLEDFVPVGASDPEEWWKTWTINMRGPYLVTRAFVPLMLKDSDDKEGGGGGDKTIINTSSIGAHLMRPGASAYQTSKFALCRFTEFLDAEYGEKGLLAYCIHPGGVMTELASRMPKNTHVLLQDTPELCADVVAWLTAEKRDWLAGRYVSVTWDMEEFLAKKDEIVSKDLLKFRMLF